MKKIFTIFTFALLSNFLFGQTPNISWDKTEYSTSDENAVSIIQLSNEEYIICGNDSPYNSDIYIYKLNKTGEKIWEKWLSGDENNNKWDEAKDIIKGEDNYFYVAGKSNSTTINSQTNNGDSDYLISKYDTSGNLIWTKLYGGTKSDEAWAMTKNSKGEIAVIGYSLSSENMLSPNKGMSDIWFLLIDKNGKILNESNFGGSNYDYAYDIISTTDNGYIIIGSTLSNNNDVTNSKGAKDVFVIKLNQYGIKQWAKTYGGRGNDAGHSIIETADGNYIFSAETSSNDSDVKNNTNKNQWDEISTELWVVKINKTDGAIIWERTYGGSEVDGSSYSNSKASSIIKMRNNTYAIATTTTSTDGLLTNQHLPIQNEPYGLFEYTLEDQWILNIDETGNLLWQKCIGTTNNDKAYDLIENKTGQLVIAGVVTNDLSDDYIYNSSTDEYEYALGGPSDNIPDQNFSLGNVTNPIGGQDAWVVELHTCNEISITSQSEASTVNKGESIKLFVNVTGQTPITYKWYRNDTLLTEQIKDTLIINNASLKDQGTYKCIVNNLCNEVSTTISLNVNTTGILNDDASNLKIYPNPAKNQLFIETNASSKISIINIIGNKLLEKEIEKGIHTIDVSKLPRGIYFVQYQSNEKRTSIKLLIQ